ncbi:RTA1 like protein [Paraphaeosphaeria sporulosa]|uniref:RTA1 like protein n=1 Tax=Paraphaeosphaeria sporulosa TaxID=1460663 RepID=A0A177CMB1_9PLEO|nr:RTA1 like protein [Paraphaeosphaeria sporulosa]OAG08436.1 RTA1 like protein [Paraphaeosphaeria sporulosa]
MNTDTGIYLYKPSLAGAIIAAGVFGISASYHVFQMVRKKAWFYSPLTVGACMMTAGYVFRYLSAKSPASLGLYIGQSLFIILPPSLYAATIYMIYGRLVVFVDAPDASIIRPTRITKIFVCGDVLAFFMQAGGGGMMAQASMATMGQTTMLVGLFIQLFFFSFFLVISLVFWKRLRNSPKGYKVAQHGKYTWSALLKLLLSAAVIIILRCVFRIVEFGQGHDGYLASHEVYMYMFDTVPMLVVQIMFHFVYATDVFGAGAVRAGSAETRA